MKKGLFSINQIVRCCGVSRSTILRLEDRGLLQPAFVDENTGYRYYDNFNASLILHVRLFLEMGMSYDDIALYYRSNGSSPELLERVEAKHLAFQRAHEEMKLRMNKREEITFEFLTLPQYVCYTRECRGDTVQTRSQAMVDLCNEAIEKGYRPLYSEPLFGIFKRTDYLEEKFVERKSDFICCIPLDPACAPEEAVVFPSCRVYSCLFYGRVRASDRGVQPVGAEDPGIGAEAHGLCADTGSGRFLHGPGNPQR